jgi:uncharacterized membrane protein YuzA (DUF378 family)
MADHAEVEYATADGNDYAEHEGTYESFVRLATVGSLLVINIVIALGVGGVVDHWLEAVGLLVFALLAAIFGLASGSNVPAVVIVLLGLLALAMK